MSEPVEDKIYRINKKNCKLVKKIDTSRHDTGFQKRVKALEGLYMVRDIDTGDIYTAYGIDFVEGGVA